MSRTVWLRIAGLLAIVGGGLELGVLVARVTGTASLYAIYGRHHYFAIWQAFQSYRLAESAQWGGLLLALLALLAALRRRAGWLGLGGILTAGLGIALVLIAEVKQFTGIPYCDPRTNCPMPDPRLLGLIHWLAVSGIALVAVGLMGLGGALASRHLLRVGNPLPVVVGGLAFSTYHFITSDGLGVTGGPVNGAEIFTYDRATIALIGLWALGWIAWGVALWFGWSRRARPAAVAPTSSMADRAT